MTESDWDELQQGWMLALALYRRTRCPCGCGYDFRESTDPAGRWHVGPPTRCYVRTALAVAKKPYLESPQPEALLFQAEREVTGG